MNLKALLLWQPGFLIRSGILVLCVLITLLVGYIHTHTPAGGRCPTTAGPA